MVGIVIVSHSQKLAEGVVEVAKMMAKNAVVVAAGGLDDGSLGTSYEKISQAAQEAYSEDGMIVLMDMGSAVMTAEMVLEDFDEEKRQHIVMIDAPLVEGAVVAAVSASCNTPLKDIIEEIKESRNSSKW